VDAMDSRYEQPRSLHSTCLLDQQFVFYLELEKYPAAVGNTARCHWIYDPLPRDVTHTLRS